MRTPSDPVDRALTDLSSGAWARGNHEQRLEKTLLRHFERSAPFSRRATPRALCVAGLAVLIGGAGFAATGGREAIKKLLIRVSLAGSEDTVFDGEVTPSNNSGDYQMQVDLGDGRQAELHVRVTPNEDGGGEETKQVSVHIAGDTDATEEKTITVQASNEPDPSPTDDPGHEESKRTIPRHGHHSEW